MEVRVAGTGDIGAIASLRSLWSAGGGHDREFEQRTAEWLTTEHDRRTTWFATVAGAQVGMASLFEYRRMPSPGRSDAWWGYVSNVAAHQDLPNSALAPHRWRRFSSPPTVVVTCGSCCREARCGSWNERASSAPTSRRALTVYSFAGDGPIRRAATRGFGTATVAQRSTASSGGSHGLEAQRLLLRPWGFAAQGRNPVFKVCGPFQLVRLPSRWRVVELNMSGSP